MVNITLDPLTKRFTQSIPEEKVCYICSSNDFVDDHHYDLHYGKISDETVPLCRRCHKTIHMYRGIHMFEDDLLDKAIKVWNKTLILLNPSLMTKELMTKDKIERSNYWLKKHGIKKKAISYDPDTKEFAQEGSFREDRSGVQTPAFPFKLPHGEPLCGWDWFNEHLNDMKDYVPKIEVRGPGINLVVNIDNKRRLEEVGWALRRLKGDNSNKKVITLNPVTTRFSKGGLLQW